MYKYTYFIPENIAPVGTKKIGVYNSNRNRVCGIPLGRLKPPTKAKRYSFCALADIHLTYDTANADFQRALTYAEENCDFTCIAGDLTSTGSISEGATNEMTLYKNIVTSYAPTKPVYAIAGNHETSYGVYVTDERIKPYTGKPLYYTVSNKPTDETERNYYNEAVGDTDVFIMLGYYGAYRDGAGGWRPSEFLSSEELQWLYNTLEVNRNKRCFVFHHLLPHEHMVGNPQNLFLDRAPIWYTESSGGSYDNGMGKVLLRLLQHYKNTILFHGHSHTRFSLQELEKTANYSSHSDSYKYRSVHIPSLAAPREPKEETETGKMLKDMYAESEGYIVDVYDDYIVLNGRDFIDNDADGHIIPIATYKIDTALAEIEANTFTDSTGLIAT